MDRRTARGRGAHEVGEDATGRGVDAARRSPWWRGRLAVCVSLGVVLAAFLGRVAFDAAFDLGGTIGQGGIAGGWSHSVPGSGGDVQHGLLYYEMQRSGAGSLLDRTEWVFIVVEGGVVIAQPDAATLARVEATLRASFETDPIGSTMWEEGLDPRPVALDLLPRGQLTTVVFDRRARAWNIAHDAALAAAVAAVIHLLAAMAMTIHGRRHGGARRVPALSRLHAVMLLAGFLLLPATCVLWVFWWQMPEPWWAFTFAPLALLVAVSIVCLLRIAARLRRASLAGDLVCTACLYDLRALPAAGHCPECGRPYERGATVRAWGAMRRGEPQRPEV